MIEKSGDIWTTLDNPKAKVLFTANNVIDKKGNLIMGAGIALQAKDRFPWVPIALGRMHKQFEGIDWYLWWWPHYQIAAIQTKRHWKDKSSFPLVKESIFRLIITAQQNPDFEFNTVRPGCGLGRLSWETIQPLLKDAPDNVCVWTP